MIWRFYTKTGRHLAVVLSVCLCLHARKEKIGLDSTQPMDEPQPCPILWRQLALFMARLTEATRQGRFYVGAGGTTQIHLFPPPDSKAS